MEIIVEKFKKKDAKVMVDMFNDPKNNEFMNIKELKVKDVIAMLDNPENATFMIWMDKINTRTPVGWCQLKFCSGEAPSIGLMIDSAHWGMGYGKIAMDFLEEEAKRMGKKHLKLMVRVKNKRAISLYKKAGYTNNNLTFEKDI